MKKSIIICSAVLLLSIILLGVYLLLSTTVYRGVIVRARVVDGNIELTVKEEKTNEPVTVLADLHTDVRYCHLEGDIYLGDLLDQEGIGVEVSCKKFFNNNNYAESIVVRFEH